MKSAPACRGAAQKIVETACEKFGAVSAIGDDADSRGFVALHCARADAADLANWLLSQGADRVSVAALEHVFDAKNPLFERLEGRIGLGEGLSLRRFPSDSANSRTVCSTWSTHSLRWIPRLVTEALKLRSEILTACCGVMERALLSAAYQPYCCA